VSNPATARQSASAVTSRVPRELLALLQLGRRARSAENVETLGFIFVNESRQLFEYRQAAVWLGARVASLSGVPQAEANAPYVQWLTEVCRELWREGGTSRAVTAATLPAVLAESWAEWLPAHALWLPLLHLDRVQGAVLFAADEPIPDFAVALANEIGPVYAHALAAFRPRRTAREHVIAVLRPTRRRILVLAALFAVALFPIRQSVPAAAEVVPLEPFLVRAPLDGVIDRFLVQPNQFVKAGTPLFVMDITALQARNNVARNAYDTALEEYRQSAQAAVTDDKSKLDVAVRRGELQERSVELQYAADQVGRVQVKAERDGLAVFADINDWQGKAVILGERILTLADPSTAALSIDFPASSNLDIRIGMPVTLYAELPYCIFHGWPAWVDGSEPDAQRDVDAYWSSFLGDVPEMPPLRSATVERLSEQQAAARLNAIDSYHASLNYGARKLLANPDFHRFEVRWNLNTL